MTIAIAKIDHLAITTPDLERMTEYYCRVLEGKVVNEYAVRGRVMIRQIRLGGAMVNIHQADHGHPLVAIRPTPGAIDVCFRWNAPIASAVKFLESAHVEITEGPSPRHASDGLEGMSVYFRDPDGNLLEFLSTYQEASDI